jgi:hypothetical protein
VSPGAPRRVVSEEGGSGLCAARRARSARRRSAALGLVGLLALPGCGHRASAPASVAEVAVQHYQDSSGLAVGTYGAWLRQRLPGWASVEAKALADHVRLHPSRGFDPTTDLDRRAPDAVTSASATAGGGKVAREWRFEGQLGADVERELAAGLFAVGLVARASGEPDYESLSGAARASAELLERSTTLSLLVGYGRDRAIPVETARGQEARWPATHERVAASLGLSQLLGPRAVLTAGLAGTWQRGALASPYRRAVVKPNLLLPEVLPDARDRHSGFLGLSLSLSPRVALHLQQGAYLDDWGVRAVIPEASLAGEVDGGVLLRGGYRYYRQTAASFYEVVYPAERAIMTGDLRLGAVRDHTLLLEARRRVSTAGHVALPIAAGYELSLLDYRGVGARVVAHVFSLSVGVEH